MLPITSFGDGAALQALTRGPKARRQGAWSKAVMGSLGGTAMSIPEVLIRGCAGHTHEYAIRHTSMLHVPL